MVGRMRIGRRRRAWQLLLPLRQEVAGLGGPRLLPVLPHAFARVCLPPCVSVPGVAHAPRRRRLPLRRIGLTLPLPLRLLCPCRCTRGLHSSRRPSPVHLALPLRLLLGLHRPVPRCTRLALALGPQLRHLLLSGGEVRRGLLGHLLLHTQSTPREEILGYA